MTNQQAIARAKKKWGSSHYVRNSGHMSSPEQRAAARQVVIDARAEIKETEDEITRRLNELDWYRELRAKQKAARQRISNTEGEAHHYRFSVGRSNGMFNSIAGQGDTWEEAFEAAERSSI